METIETGDRGSFESNPEKEQIPPEELKRLLDFVYTAHQEHNTRKDFRQEGKVPFVVHPIWCATTLLNDQRIPFEQRRIGYQALLLHDVLEDTSLPLPDFVGPEVKDAVEQMSHGTWEDEQVLEGKSDFVKLLKLCDKMSSIFDETVRPDPQRRSEWKALTTRLYEDVKEAYGETRIVTLCKAMLDSTDW